MAVNMQHIIAAIGAKYGPQKVLASSENEGVLYKCLPKHRVRTYEDGYASITLLDTNTTYTFMMDGTSCSGTYYRIDEHGQSFKFILSRLPIDKIV